MLKGNLTCTIIGKLLTHYVEDNLDNKCKEMVTIHLRNCPPCMEKYTIVKKLFNEAEKKRKIIKERERMQEEISAYLDGEMSEAEISKFEQKLSKSPEYEEAMINTMKIQFKNKCSRKGDGEIKKIKRNIKRNKKYSQIFFSIVTPLSFRAFMKLSAASF